VKSRGLVDVILIAGSPLATAWAAESWFERNSRQRSLLSILKVLEGTRAAFWV